MSSLFRICLGAVLVLFPGVLFGLDHALVVKVEGSLHGASSVFLKVGEQLLDVLESPVCPICVLC